MGEVPIYDSLLKKKKSVTGKIHKYLSLVLRNPCVAQAGGVLKTVSRLR